MIRRGRWGLASVLIAALVLAGCGGSSSSGTLSRAQLVSRANAACSATNARIADQAGPSSLKQLAGYASSTRAATVQLQHSLSEPASK